MRESIKENLIVLMIYFFCAIIFTFPLIIRFTSSIPAESFISDPFLFIWQNWWFKYSIFELNKNPFFNDYLWSPFVVNITQTTDSYFNIGLSFILAQFFPQHIAYNIEVLLAFVLTAFFSFLLIKYLTNHTTASLVGGFLFGFSTFMLSRGVTHLNIMSAEFIPLAILFLLKLQKNKRLYYAILFSLAIFLNFLASSTYFIFIITFSIVEVIIYHITVDRSFSSYIKVYLAVFLFTLLLMMPLMLIISSLLVDSNGGMLSFYDLGYSLVSNFSYATDFPFLFILPPVTSLGKLLSGFYTKYIVTLPEKDVYLGIPEVAILVVGLFIKEFLKKVKLWYLIFLSFLIFSMGPILKFFQAPVSPFGKLIVPLPYFLIMYLPPFIFLRTPNRFIIFSLLAVAVIVSFFMKEKKLTSRPLFFAIICASFLIERLTLPYNLENIERPKFFNDIKNDRSDYSLFIIPTDSILNTLANYDQTIHNKRIVGGALHSLIIRSSEFNNFYNAPENSFLRKLSCTFNQGDNAVFSIDVEDKKKFEAFLSKSRSKYIVVYTETLLELGEKKDDFCYAVAKNFSKLIDGYPLIYEDRLISVYSVGNLPKHYD